MAADGPRTRTSAAGDTRMADTTQAAPVDAVDASGRPWPPGDESRARFQVGLEVARGGMGRVVAARDKRLGRAVAIKEALDADVATLHRFEREVQITARLQHPAIVPVYDAGRWPSGLPYYVMRLVSGRPLLEHIEKARSLGERLALVPSFLAAADAVGFAHREGIIHRDLKPSNVLLGEHGETVVIDWGLAKVVGEAEARPEPGAANEQGGDGRRDDEVVAARPGDDAARPGDDAARPGDDARRGLESADTALAADSSDGPQTRVGSVLGTPGYMAPEQAAGDPVDARSDVYALGATLYHLLAGAPPHDASGPTGAIAQALDGSLPPLASRAPGTPAELLAIVDKAMATAPDQRYQDGSALAADVRRFLTGQLVAAHRYSARDRVGRFARRHRAALAVAGLAALVLVVTVAIGLSRIVAAKRRAESARIDAEAGWRSAEDARRRAQDRGDDLLLARAHGLLDSDPTAAAVLVGRLPLDSAHWARARAILLAARSRGIARALPGRRDMVVSLDADPGDRRLLSRDRSGQVEVHDLERWSSRVIAPAPPEGDPDSTRGAVWAEGGRSVAIARGPRLLLIDLATGDERLIATAASPITQLVGPADASFVAWLDQSGRSALAAPPSWRAEPLEDGPEHSSVQVSPDGRWLATMSQNQPLRVWQRGRRDPIVTADADCFAAFAPAGARAAISCGPGEIVEWDLERSPPAVRGRWRAPEAPSVPAYGGDALYLMTARGELVGLHAGGKTETRLTSSRAMLPAALRGGIALSSGTEQLVLIEGWWTHTLHLPGMPVVRLAVADGGRLLAAGTRRGAILVFDLDPVRPRAVPVRPGASVIEALTGDTAVLGSAQGEIDLVDVAAGTAREVGRVGGYPGYSRLADDRSTLVIASMMGEVAAVRMADGAFDLLAERGGSLAELSGSTRAVWHRGGELWEAVLFSDEAERRIASWQADPVGIAARGGWLAGALDDGTLWRRAPGTSAIEQLQSGRVLSGALEIGPDGAVYAAVEREVLRWRSGAAERLATLSDRVLDLALDPALGLSAVTADGAVHLIAPGGGAVRSTPLSAPMGPIDLSRRGGRATGRDSASHPIAIDLAGGLGHVLVAAPALDVRSSDDGAATATLMGGQRLVVFSHDLPREPAALRAWLARATNAAVDDRGTVTWPAR